MPCENDKDALIEVAASGAAPQGNLRAHLNECACCRAAFNEEQSLFAAIDSGLQTAINVEVSPSLLPRVRACLDEAAESRFQWARLLIFASATAALALVIFLITRLRHESPESLAEQGSVVAPIRKAPEMNMRPERIVRSGTQIASVRASHLRSAGDSTNVHSAASGNLEVLVPPDEREGLAKLVATLNEHRDAAAAFLAQRPEKKDTLVIVDPLQISDIEIKPLDGAETETSDGAGERH
ncbi:MAG TPA: hypothetical protein VJN92_00355 [Candidatus Acidoferrum sp.]|nr:hypothetical protein [Candidatus Acidoferrum sp.]